MTKKTFRKLNTGDFVKTSTKSPPRKILKAQKIDGETYFIILRKISTASHRLWSGFCRKHSKDSTTVYIANDAKKFRKVYRKMLEKP